jgi:hypothetical protein
MRELERIKKERAEETARVEAQKRLLEEKAAKEAALAANPLLVPALLGKSAAPGAAIVKRRWVFACGVAPSRRRPHLMS